jgi:serine protease Do
MGAAGLNRNPSRIRTLTISSSMTMSVLPLLPSARLSDPLPVSSAPTEQHDHTAGGVGIRRWGRSWKQTVRPPKRPLGLSLFLSGCLLMGGCTGIKSPLPTQEESQPIPSGSSNESKSDLPPNFIVKVVDKVGSAVVRINSSRRVVQDPSNSVLENFLNIPPEQSEQIERGTGSGFIFAANGLVMTNRHVVNGADQVTVLLKDGREFQGRVLGEDPLTDVAVVKIESTNLPTVKLGDSRQMSPGNWAIAIGNPLGLDNTVTVGIVSAIGRPAADIGNLDLRVRFIQTDAAINPGNSGGPLLNERGEVIGVNTAIIQGAQGLGFAIPIEDAQRIAQQLATSGKVERAYLGVEMVDLKPESRDRIQKELQRKIEAEKGVYVVRVVPNSPAAKGGIKPGDLIEAINNKPIQNTEELQRTIEQSKSGAIAEVKVNRQGQRRPLSITLGNLPTEAATPEPQ